jgi:hypothetical protein
MSRNAITERVDVLAGQWNTFAVDPDARALRWVCDPEERRMVDVFVTLQTEDVGTVPDLFVTLEQPFEDYNQHGFLLAQELWRRYEADRETLAEAGLASDWTLPPASRGQSDVAYFLGCACSLQAKYAAVAERLALYLSPSAVEDREAWGRWLEQACAAPLPREVRILYVDDVSAPALEPRGAVAKRQTRSVRPELDMGAAYLDLARGAGPATPGTAFRLKFVQLNTAAGAGDLPGAERAASDAKAIALEQGWPHLHATVLLALGGAYFGAGDPVAAWRAYAEAASAGTEASALPMLAEVGPKLTLQATIGQAGALFALGDLERAASTYSSAAERAETQHDAVMAMDCWRMAATCHEGRSDRVGTTRAATSALRAGKAIDPQIRAQTTLPLVGLLLAKAAGGDASGHKKLHEEMSALVGPDWEQRAAAFQPRRKA